MALAEELDFMYKSLENIDNYNIFISLKNKATTIFPSLALKKYYIWNLKHTYNIIGLDNNTSLIFYRDLVKNLENKSDFKENNKYLICAAEAYYCLAEIYFEKKDYRLATSAWKKSKSMLEDRTKSSIKDLISETAEEGIRHWEIAEKHLKQWSVKNIADAYNTKKSIKLYKSIIEDEESLLFLEKYLGIYNISVQISDIDSAYNAFQKIQEFCPNYKDINRKSFEFFYNNNFLFEAVNICISEFKRTYAQYWIDELINIINDKKYINNEIVNEYVEIAVLLIEQCELKKWMSFVEGIFKCASENEVGLLEILKHLELVLTKIEYSSKIYEKFYGILDLLKNIVEYIDVNKYKYLYLKDFEVEFNKYLAYAANTNNKEEYIYTALTKLSVLREKSNIDNTSFEFIDEIEKVFKVSDCSVNYELINYPWTSMIKKIKLVSEKAGYVSKGLWGNWFKNKDSKKKVFIVGNFSNGKSTLINSILEDKILKAKITPTTGVLTFIEAGENIKLRLFENKIDDVGIEIAVSKLEEVTVIDDENNLNKRSFVGLKLQSRVLEKNKFIIIDTPGFEDLNEENSNKALEYIDAADCVVMVIDVNKPITAGEGIIIELLSNKISSSKILFVLNKVDTLDEEEDELNQIIQYVAENITKIIKDKPNIITYSALENLKNKTSEELAVEISKLMPQNINEHRFNECEKYIKDEIKNIYAHESCKIKKLEDKNTVLQNSSEKLKDLKRIIEKIKEGAEVTFNEDMSNLKNNIDKKIKVQVPQILNDNLNVVNHYSDSKDLRDKVEKDLRGIIIDWCVSNIEKYFEEEFNMYLSKLEKTFKEHKQIIEDILDKRIKILNAVNEIPLNDEEVQLYCWEKLRDRISLYFMQFAYSQIYAVSILPEKGTFHDLSRGFSSFFSGTEEVLKETRNKIKNQIKSNDMLAARRLSENIFSEFEEVTEKISKEIITIFNNIIDILEESLKELDEIIREYNNKLTSTQEQMSNISIKLYMAENDLLVYRKQFEKGVVYNDGKLYKAV